MPITQRISGGRANGHDLVEQREVVTVAFERQHMTHHMDVEIGGGAHHAGTGPGVIRREPKEQDDRVHVGREHLEWPVGFLIIRLHDRAPLFDLLGWHAELRELGGRVINIVLRRCAQAVDPVTAGG